MLPNFPFFAKISQTSTNSTVSHTSIREENYPKLFDPNLKIEIVLEGLFLPTSISFIAENDFIVSQKNGTVGSYQ